MKLQGATVLVTGANRGLGLAFAQAALARGARKVYAGARDPASITLPGLVPLRLDVTREADVQAAAQAAGDTTLLVNNAGIGLFGGVLRADGEAHLRQHLETNLFGLLRMSRAFAPVLARHGGGAMLNVASAVSWVSGPRLANYAVSKSAMWSLTNALRNELRGQGTQVLAVHMGLVDTGMVQAIDAPKLTPEAVVAAAYEALEADASEVIVDESTRRLKAGLCADPPVYLVPR